jgi:hypothetical protein
MFSPVASGSLPIASLSPPIAPFYWPIASHCQPIAPFYTPIASVKRVSIWFFIHRVIAFITPYCIGLFASCFQRLGDVYHYPATHCIGVSQLAIFLLHRFKLVLVVISLFIWK